MSKVVVGKKYLELVGRFPLRPIRSDKELDRATAVIDELIGARRRTREEEDYLDVLSDLVKKYEDEHYPIPDVSPVEILKTLIEDRRSSQRAVAFGSGIAVSTISDILAGRRQMTLGHMQKLSRHFNVELSLFLPREAPVASPKRAAARPRRKAFA